MPGIFRFTLACARSGILVVGVSCGAAAWAQTQTVTVKGWNFCKDKNAVACVAGTGNVPVFTDDGSPAGTANLSAASVAGQHKFDSAYNFVQITASGCGARKNEPCWIDESLVVVEHCKLGSMSEGGLGTTQTQMGTSMGSGAGCLQ